MDPEDIEDTYTLATNVERRIAMQAFVQDFVDQAISSTINVPEWGEYGNSNAKKFSQVLLKYLPKLRGITVYPDGSRPGQPITPIKYETALKHNVVIEESEEKCVQGVCSI
jgi:ribonucleoside-diphosphate reductase alpha chain